MNCYDMSPMMPAGAAGSSCGCGMMSPPRPSAPSSDFRPAPAVERSRFPIGMGYVPWQTWQQPYSLEQGFRRGTIFPELDLPFMMGRCR